MILGLAGVAGVPSEMLTVVGGRCAVEDPGASLTSLGEEGEIEDNGLSFVLTKENLIFQP